MTPEQIKTECELLYEAIRLSESRLKELRSICKHENTFNGNYSYRVGSVSRAVICFDCGSLIKQEFSGKPYVVGEKGPELKDPGFFNPNEGGRKIIPNDD